MPWGRLETTWRFLPDLDQMTNTSWFLDWDNLAILLLSLVMELTMLLLSRRLMSDLPCKPELKLLTLLLISLLKMITSRPLWKLASGEEMFMTISEDSSNSSLLSMLLPWSFPSSDQLSCGTLLSKLFSFSGSTWSWTPLPHLLLLLRIQKKISCKDHHTERESTSSPKRWSSTS